MREKGFRGYMLNEALYKMRDDRKAYNRRLFIYRVNESKVIISAVNRLHLPIYMYLWALKPLGVGILPLKIYQLLHRSRY